VRSFGHTYARLILASIGTAAAIALLGYYPTLRVAGPDAIGAMFAGIIISMVAGLVGAVPIGLAVRGDPAKVPNAILMATAIRFVVVLALTASVVFGSAFDRNVLGLWVGISYLAMLVVDTSYAVHIVGRVRGDRR
jgi:hypothetical protein